MSESMRSECQPVPPLWQRLSRNCGPYRRDTSTPADAEPWQMAATGSTRDKGRSSSQVNKGPGKPGCMAKQPRTAATRHEMSHVAPTYSVTPEPNTLVLLCRKVTTRYSGLLWLLTQMSPPPMGAWMSYKHSMGEVNSPDCRKAKKRRQHAAGDQSTRNN